jgi:hypothetical protein
MCLNLHIRNSSAGATAVFAGLLDAPPDWFFTPAGSWARPIGDAEQNRHKKERRKKRRKEVWVSSFDPHEKPSS